MIIPQAMIDSVERPRSTDIRFASDRKYGDAKLRITNSAITIRKIENSRCCVSFFRKLGFFDSATLVSVFIVSTIHVTNIR